MAPAPPSPVTLLGGHQQTDLTPTLGTLFDSSTQLSHLFSSPDALSELSTLISQRGVVFFSSQDIDIHQQKDLARALGQYALPPRPEGSGLHKHPISENSPELGADTSVISSMGGIARARERPTARASRGWHTDISFEHVPADFSILKMHTLPDVGGDTLWANGYEAYDRLSPAFKIFLEGLTAEHDGNFFHDEARRLGVGIQDKRGHDENTGEDLRAVHPVIRTHPVTGWKSLYVNRTFTTKIVELAPEESSTVLDYLFRHISENHDLQVRYRWEKNDVAIWDNRCTFHTATNDYGAANRQGNRVVGIGEKPFFDPKSKSRREALDA